MNFGEKLYKLRKEKNYSQEDLAEQLNTSRQAISKWENGQGYPETEKLLALGNIFEVSIDYLLKESDEENAEYSKGYYVSREMASGFLLNERKLNTWIAMGAFFIFLSGVPYILLQGDKNRQVIMMAICIVAGIGCIITAALKDVGKYKVLRREPLIFDKTFLKELSNHYQGINRKYSIVAGCSFMLLILGVIPIFFVIKGFVTQDIFSRAHSLCFILMAIGMVGFVVSISMLEAYRLLVKNEEHTNRLTVKVMRKIRRIMENL